MEEDWRRFTSSLGESLRVANTFSLIPNTEPTPNKAIAPPATSQVSNPVFGECFSFAESEAIGVGLGLTLGEGETVGFGVVVGRIVEAGVGDVVPAAHEQVEDEGQLFKRQTPT